MEGLEPGGSVLPHGAPSQRPERGAGSGAEGQAGTRGLREAPAPAPAVTRPLPWSPHGEAEQTSPR